MSKNVLKKIVKIIGGILMFFGFYIMAVLLLPLIEIHAEKTSQPKIIQAYIMTNGVHTDIVLPVRTRFVDWNQKFPCTNTISKDCSNNYIGIGWGDKGFYLDTPTWADLKFSTAFKAAFWLGESAIHTTFYKNIKMDNSVRSFTMTEDQYMKLINFIDTSLDHDSNRKYIYVQTNAQYGKNDAFYEAKGSYSFMFTCNTWANDALKAAGQEAALWTATDTGIFRHYEQK